MQASQLDIPPSSTLAMERPYLSVVAPVFNEEQTLPHFYERLLQVLEGLDEPFEMVLVDDGSRDISPASTTRSAPGPCTSCMTCWETARAEADAGEVRGRGHLAVIARSSPAPMLHPDPE